MEEKELIHNLLFGMKRHSPMRCGEHKNAEFAGTDKYLNLDRMKQYQTSMHN